MPGNKNNCTYYGGNGHTTDTCYMKHGFSLHFGKYSVMANKSSLELNEEIEDDDDLKRYKGNNTYGFTKEKYDQLMNLLHSPSSNANHNALARKVNLVTHKNNHILLCFLFH